MTALFFGTSSGLIPLIKILNEFIKKLKKKLRNPIASRFFKITREKFTRCSQWQYSWILALLKHCRTYPSR